MAQIAFPVLARTAGADELFALRQRMVQLLTVVLFPLLALLAAAGAGRRALALRARVGAGRACRRRSSPRRRGDRL